MSSVLGSLVRHLGLDDSYTLFVMNPQPPLEKGQLYGYEWVGLGLDWVLMGWD